MKGLYLYCVRGKGVSKFFTKGIGGGEVFAVPYKDLPPHQSQLRSGEKCVGRSKDWCGGLEAVVSEISLEEFGSEEIKKKAREDLKWIKEKAQLHEKVIEEAMGYPRGITAVIPMKFGAIFKTRAKLEELLKKYYPKFRKILKKITGKQEWSVKVYLNKKLFREEVKKMSSLIKSKEKEIAILPEGAAYFAQKQVDEIVEKEINEMLKKYIEIFFENIKKCAETGKKGKILEKELTGESLPMILNATFFVPEENLKDFVKRVRNLNKKFRIQGFVFKRSGPWPPYNFI